MSNNTTSELIEDHALEPVPNRERRGWLDISWNTAGIVTTLASLFAGALVTFIGGLTIGLLAGGTVAVFGMLLGWGLGHIAYSTGLSSTVMSRHYGFGIKGSILGSSIFGFMIIGIIGVENILLYKGFLFYFSAADTLATRIFIYTALTLMWVLLTAYGFSSVTRFSSVMLLAFLGVLVYMMFVIISQSDYSWNIVFSFDSQFPHATLEKFDATTDSGKFIACVNLLMGTAGALAFVDADLGRYARSSRDIAIAALIGNVFLDIVMVLLGGVIIFAGMPALIEHYISVAGLTEAAAKESALESPDAIAAAFIVFGGGVGAFLMVAAQAKAQVLNTYSGALSLANLADVGLSWRPGRFHFVVLANLLSLLFLYRDLLEWYFDFLVSLGILTTCLASVMLSDYFVLKRSDRSKAVKTNEQVNWAGVGATTLGFLLAHYALDEWIRLEALTGFVVTFFVYPLLRKLENRV